MEEELKTVATFYDAMSARITAGMLMDNGIPAGVFGDNSSYICLNYVNPVEVKVNASDYDAALKLLEMSEESAEGEEGFEEGTEGEENSSEEEA